MHLRRALLLFAIVLGLAALATSVTRAPRDGDRDEPTPPSTSTEETASPGPGTAAELRLPGPRGGRSVALESGRAVTLLVSVREPGEVELPDLGLTTSAEPLTPARFELLGPEPGSYAVRFTPAEEGESRALGRLVVR